MNSRRSRRVSWRSHRRLRQVLLAFGSAGFALGIILLFLYGYARQGILLWLGGVYVLLACMLFGVRSILGHLDDLRRRRRYHPPERGTQFS